MPKKRTARATGPPTGAMSLRPPTLVGLLPPSPWHGPESAPAESGAFWPESCTTVRRSPRRAVIPGRVSNAIESVDARTPRPPARRGAAPADDGQRARGCDVVGLPREDGLVRADRRGDFRERVLAEIGGRPQTSPAPSTRPPCPQHPGRGAERLRQVYSGELAHGIGVRDRGEHRSRQEYCEWSGHVVFRDAPDARDNDLQGPIEQPITAPPH